MQKVRFWLDTLAYDRYAGIGEDEMHPFGEGVLALKEGLGPLGKSE
jgi:hypothetical protein